jgi:hypothetical protein
MGSRAFLTLVVTAIVAAPAWAFGPARPSGSNYSLQDRGIVVAPGGSYGNIAPLEPSRTVAPKNAAARDRAVAWNRFVARTAPGWSARWNRLTATPHLAFGPPITLAAVKGITHKNLKDVGLGFVADNASLLGITPEQLAITSTTKAGGRWHIRGRQIHQGVPVLGSQLKLSFTNDDRLVMFGSDVYPDVAVETEPTIEQKQAMQLAGQDALHRPAGGKISQPELNIVPLRRPEGFDYLLCWKLYVNDPNTPAKWRYLIDAHRGVIIGKMDTLMYLDVTGAVRGEYKPEFADDPTEIVPFPYQNVSAKVPEVEIASWDFDTDPCFTAEGLWQYGQPNDGEFEFCVGPNSAYTGDNVYGYNLYGDYPNDINAQYLTTTAIDCSAYDSVHLKFIRWLGVESQRWDHATVEASSDANNWITIGENPGGTICDGRWLRASYDISAVAAHQPSVYIRWAMGPIDVFFNLPGWYIDDVKVVAMLEPTNTAQTQPDGSYVVTAPQDPTTISSELKGLYCDVNHDCAPDASFELADVYPPDVVDFTWNSDWYADLVEANVYWHVSYVHDYFVALDPSLSSPSAAYPSGLDFSIPVTVKTNCLDGLCNAFTDGRSITFGASRDPTCDDFGMYSEVAYHEYGHVATVKVYEGVLFPYHTEPGAMHEAWSDYFAHILSPSQSPLIGDGGLFPNSPEGFRTLDNTYRRETDFSNNVHFDSQTVSGSLWQIRQTIDGQLEPDEWDQIVHFARYAHPQNFEDYLLAVLAEDDSRYGDAYLANGTPHAQTIYEAFGSHGIGGLQYVAPSIVFDDATGNADGKLDPGETAEMSLSLINGWADAAGVSATLVSADPFVAISKDSALFPDVEHGGVTNNASDAFTVSLDPGCPETHTINFALQIAADGPYDYSRTSLLTYPVAFRQLVYDDGQVDDLYVSSGVAETGLAVRVTPQSYPCRPMTVRLMPNPDSDVTTNITVWDDDGPGGLPGTTLGTVAAKIRAFDGWFDLDISSMGLVVDNGSFYVGWIEDRDRFYTGLDMDPPYYNRSWAVYAWGGTEQWVNLSDFGFLGNLMVRVRYFYTSADGPVENLTSGKRYDYIQYAIYDANDGDEIVVSLGTYDENINFLDKNVTVRSSSPNDPAVVAATVIHGRHRGPAVTFSSGQTRDCILTGFTITGAHKGPVNKGAISCRDLGQTGPAISNCVIADNNGPGIYANNSGPAISRCTITANEDDGIELHPESHPTVTNCIIARNLRHGIRGGWPTVKNCTIVENTLLGLFHSSAVIVNSIIWNNGDEQVDAAAEASYCNIQGGRPGLGNIDIDPCFADPNVGDYHLKSTGWRWDADANQWTWDDVTSRCIDAGNPGSALRDEPVTLDIDPLNRFGQNLRINMGAYGGTEQAGMGPHGWALLADLTNDGVVDSVDLAHLLQFWAASGADLPADLDRDAHVDGIDFALLAGDWASTTSWHE